jgi:hypothetical protein
MSKSLTFHCRVLLVVVLLLLFCFCFCIVEEEEEEEDEEEEDELALVSPGLRAPLVAPCLPCLGELRWAVVVVRSGLVDIVLLSKWL